MKKTECNSKKFHLIFLVEMFVPMLGMLAGAVGCWIAVRSWRSLRKFQKKLQHPIVHIGFLYAFCN